MSTTTAGWVSLDGFFPVLAQWNRETHWNGWLCPSLDAWSVVKVLEAINVANAAPVYRYDWSDDGSLILFEVQEDEQYLEVLPPDPDGLYGLGNYGWVWSEEQRIMGTFRAVVTRDGAALARDGEPYMDLSIVEESDTKGLAEGGDLFEVQFTDGQWMLVRAADLVLDGARPR